MFEAGRTCYGEDSWSMKQVIHGQSFRFRMVFAAVLKIPVHCNWPLPCYLQIPSKTLSAPSKPYVHSSANSRIKLPSYVNEVDIQLSYPIQQNNGTDYYNSFILTSADHNSITYTANLHEYLETLPKN